MGLIKQKKYKQHVETPRPSAPGMSFRKTAERSKQKDSMYKGCYFYLPLRRGTVRSSFQLLHSADFLYLLKQITAFPYSVKCHISLLQTFITPHTKIHNFMYHLWPIREFTNIRRYLKGTPKLAKVAKKASADDHTGVVYSQLLFLNS